MNGNAITHPARSIRLRYGAWSGRILEHSPLHAVFTSGAWPPDIEDPRHIHTLKRNPKVHSGLLTLEDGTQYFFKRFTTPPLRRHLRRLVAQPRARANWRLSRQLERHGVPVARAQALATGPSESWFLAEAFADAVSLAKLSRKGLIDSADLLATTHLLAEIIGTMHGAGIIHGDLKWGNILMHPSCGPIIADLDSARQVSRVSPARAAPDLARFLVSGLEQGLTASWADDITRRYAQARGMKAEQLVSEVRPLVRKISRAHQRRYGRSSVDI